MPVFDQTTFLSLLLISEWKKTFHQNLLQEYGLYVQTTLQLRRPKFTDFFLSTRIIKDKMFRSKLTNEGDFESLLYIRDYLIYFFCRIAAGWFFEISQPFLTWKRCHKNDDDLNFQSRVVFFTLDVYRNKVHIFWEGRNILHNLQHR